MDFEKDSLKTVQQLAREYGVSTQAIRKRIRRLTTKLPTNATMVVNQVLYVSPLGEPIICNGLRWSAQPVDNQVDNQNDQVDNQVDNQNDQPEQPFTPVEDRFNMVLTEQLKIKDEQISELLRQNAELIKQLEGFQQLMKNEQFIKALPMAASAQPTPETAKTSLFKKFFGKGEKRHGQHQHRG
jgi:DNA-binding transcriptional MerR regulator